MGKAKITARNILATQRRTRAWELKLQHHTNAEIGDELGISPQAVGKLLKQHFGLLKEEELEMAVEYRGRLLAEAEQAAARLHRMRAEVLSAALVDRSLLLKIEERIEKNLALRDKLTREEKAPVIVTPQVNVGNPLAGLNVHDVLAQAEEWERQARQPIVLLAHEDAPPLPPAPAPGGFVEVATEVAGE